MEKWVLMAKRADFKALAERFGISPVLARLMVNRGINSEAAIEKYLNGTLDDLYEPHSMKDIVKAAEMIVKAAAQGDKIAIASDFDVDGIFSGFILYTAFCRVGAVPEILTPDRTKEGYGLNERIVTEAYHKGIRLIVTCDNGIAAFEPIAHAKSLGMTVIVTDHHDIPYEEDEAGVRRNLRTEADAIVNPKQPDCAYPFKKLCGAGVAFKLVQVLYELCGIKKRELHTLVQYAAIATVADVMDLEDENRIIVKYGLMQLANTDNLGLQALIGVCRLNPEKISAYHIGFVLGPCFNAAGRLETVKIALELLMSKNISQAEEIAIRLKNLNESRKEMTVRGFEQAVAVIEEKGYHQDKIIVVCLENCHESLVGIIAGRIKEKYYRPTIVFTNVEGGMVKGSARSIEAYNMFEGLTQCKALLTKFGGHPMAAGMSLPAKNLDALRQRLNENCRLTASDLIPVVKIDVAMPIGYITENFVEQLELLEPFGKGNIKPVFAEKHFKVIKAAVIGKNRNVLKMTVCNEQHTMMEALYFGDIEAFDSFVAKEYGKAAVDEMYRSTMSGVDLALSYYPSINEYMGNRKLQIIVQSYCRIKG